jgi:hypothetical protein
MAAIDMLSRHTVSLSTNNVQKGGTYLRPWIDVHPDFEHDCLSAYSDASRFRYGQAKSLSRDIPSTPSVFVVPSSDGRPMVEREDSQRFSDGRCKAIERLWYDGFVDQRGTL